MSLFRGSAQHKSAWQIETPVLPIQHRYAREGSAQHKSAWQIETCNGVTPSFVTRKFSPTQICLAD